MRLAARLDADRQAVFCLATGQPPEVYRSLTRLERERFLRLALPKR